MYISVCCVLNTFHVCLRWVWIWSRVFVDFPNFSLEMQVRFVLITWVQTTFFPECVFGRGAQALFRTAAGNWAQEKRFKITIRRVMAVYECLLLFIANWEVFDVWLSMICTFISIWRRNHFNLRICKTVVILWIELITFHVVARKRQNIKKVGLSVSTLGSRLTFYLIMQ